MNNKLFDCITQIYQGNRLKFSVAFGPITLGVIRLFLAFRLTSALIVPHSTSATSKEHD